MLHPQFPGQSDGAVRRARSSSSASSRSPREHDIYVVHDLAYADIVFDGYRAPSIMQVPGAKEIAVEFFTLSKSYNMAGWRVGFMVGNRELVDALARIKSYLDYGTFTPIQVASIAALEGPQECVARNRDTYQQRRDVLVRGLNQVGWPVEMPEGDDVRLGAAFRSATARSARSSSRRSCCATPKIAVSPGIGFGDHGDGHVRFALIENEERTRQAIRGIRRMFEQG